MKDLFAKEKIEYYATLAVEDVRITYPELLDREDMTPRSVILYLVPYYVGECKNISRYAASLDYHIYIRELSERIAEHLRARFPSAKLKGFGDHSPIDEIGAAAAAGLGVRGKNRLLLNEKYGSYVFIGEVITDIPPKELGAVAARPAGECINCGKCLAACPTGTLVGRAECLSYITQKKGELTDGEKELMRCADTAWGCDLCQSACPYNSEPRQTPIDFFYRERMTELTREALDLLNREELRRRAFGWRGRRTLERNLDVFKQK